MLYPYQIKYVNDKNRMSIWHKSRQIGMSFASGYEAVFDCVLNNTNKLIVSSSQRQSNIIMTYVERFLEIFRKINSLKNLRLTIDTKTEKRFAHNDKAIFCLPCNPVAIRGFNGDIILDEFAFHRNDEQVYSASIGCITRGYKIKIISTGLGNKNLFYRINHEYWRHQGFKRKRITIYDAINNGLDLDISEIKNSIDETTFRQEYLCEFVDETSAYFPYDLLISAIDDYDLPSDTENYIGIDIGRHNDNTVIAIISKIGNIYFLKNLEALKEKNFDEQYKIINQIIYDANPVKIYIDKTGIGMQLAEDLERNYVQAEGLMFTNNIVNELIVNAKKLFETRKFKIYDDKKLISDFHSITRAVSRANKVSYKTERTAEGHGDRAWAVMLGLLAGKNISKPKIYYEAV